MSEIHKNDDDSWDKLLQDVCVTPPSTADKEEEQYLEELVEEQKNTAVSNIWNDGRCRIETRSRKCEKCDEFLVMHNETYRKCPKCNAQFKMLVTDDICMTSHATYDPGAAARSWSSGTKSSVSYPNSDSRIQRQSTMIMDNINRAEKSGVTIDRAYIRAAVMKYCGISDEGNNLLFRGAVQKSIIAVFIRQEAMEKGDVIDIDDIYKAFGITSTTYSKAAGIIKDLEERGIISPSRGNDTCWTMLTKFTKTLKLVKYRDFLYDFIKRAEECNLYVVYSCQDDTKCASAIYILTLSYADLYKSIDAEMIHRKCKVTPATFMGNAKELLAHKLAFKPVYIAHKILMPNCWKKKTVKKHHATTSEDSD